MRPVIPPSEGKLGDPIQIRFSTTIMARLDAVATETGHDRTDLIRHLVRWALDEHDAQRTAERAEAHAKHKRTTP